MTSIQDLLERLPNIANVSLECYSKNPKILFPLRDTSQNLQMLFYWWSEALRDLDSFDTGTEIVQGEPQQSRPMPIPPTLLSTQEQLEYITNQLKSLSTDTDTLLSEVSFPDKVKYKVERGYDKVMEALFNTATAYSHYGAINKIRG